MKNDYVKLLDQQKLDLEQKDLELQQLREDNEKVCQWLLERERETNVHLIILSLKIKLINLKKITIR